MLKKNLIFLWYLEAAALDCQPEKSDSSLEPLPEPTSTPVLKKKHMMFPYILSEESRSFVDKMFIKCGELLDLYLQFSPSVWIFHPVPASKFSSSSVLLLALKINHQ